MSRKTTPLDGSVVNVTNGQVKEAIVYIASLLTRQDKKETPTSIAALLRYIGGEELRTTHRTTVARWIERNTLTKIRKMEQSAKNVVVLAEKRLRRWQEMPNPIRIGMVANSVGSIPFHVLVHLSKKNQTNGVTFEPSYLDHSVGLYNQLSVKFLDFVIAPRDDPVFNLQGFPSDKMMKPEPFCTVATIKTAAILPGCHEMKDVEKLFKETRQRIGILTGSGAVASCYYFCRKYPHFSVCDLADASEAFDKLKNQEIIACLGHPQFIHRVMMLIQMDREDNSRSQVKHLQSLVIYQDNLFDPVFRDIEMTVFFNPIKMKGRSNIACDLFHGLSNAMDYLEEHKFKLPLQKVLNKMLDVKDSAHEVDWILNGENDDAYRFHIKDINASTLRKLWPQHSA